jgi:Lon protease-like protein
MAMRPKRIPIFPLNVVLLPGMALPLHIFEPRYKLMVGRCLEEKLVFGMLLESDSGMARVGCTAEILQKLKDYPDGRMDILTEGRAAFRLLELLDEKEYYEGRVDYLAEDHSPQDARKEIRLKEAFRQAHRLLFGQDWVSPEKDQGVSLAYVMAGLLPLELEEKQELLEMPAENDRREFLLDWLTESLPKLSRRQRIRHRAGGNGHGLN